MADDADLAEQLRETMEGLLRLRPIVEFPFTGECYNCGTPLDDGLRWCGPECAADHSARMAAAKRNPTGE